MKSNNALLPRFIALCGYPTSGKSTVQGLLTKIWDFQPVDDGGPLRQIAMTYLGLSHDDVYTQDGKLRSTELNGKSYENRQILGELGNAFEEKFGGDIIPLMVANRLSIGVKYVFGSVRREQGFYYKKLGGVVIGIRRPGVEPSKFEFDRFNEAAVDYWIENDGDLVELEQKLFNVLTRIAMDRDVVSEVPHAPLDSMFAA